MFKRRGANWIDLPLAREQDSLLREAAQTFVTDGQWPTWQGLRRTMGLGATDGERFFADLPQLGVQGRQVYGRSYELAWTTNGRIQVSLPDEARIQLTVAGLWRGGAHDLVNEYFAVLAAAVKTSKEIQPDLTTVTLAIFTSDEVAMMDQTAPTFAAAARAKESWVYELLRYELPFATFVRNDPAPPPDALRPAWSFALADGIESYASITSIEAYIDTIAANVAQLNAGLATPVNAGAAGGVEPAASWLRRAIGEGSSILVQSARSVVSKAVEHGFSVVGGSVGVVGILAWLGRHLF